MVMLGTVNTVSAWRGRGSPPLGANPATVTRQPLPSYHNTVDAKIQKIRMRNMREKYEMCINSVTF